MAPILNRAVQQSVFLTSADVDGHFDAARLGWSQPIAALRLVKSGVSHTRAAQRRAEVLFLSGLELRRTLSVQGDTRTVVEDLQVIRG